MSNHSGSYMLNGFLHGLVENGILKHISATQKKSICDLADNGYCVRCDQEAQQAQMRAGEADLLRRLLQHRFGSLPRWVSHRMQNAPEEELLHWGERLLDDPSSLEEVFGSSEM